MSAPDQSLEERIARELRDHTDPDYAWGKWYCSCGVILRSGHTQMAAHRQDIERKLREDAAGG